MKFNRLAIPDVVLIEPKIFGDARGYFFESWRSELFEKEGLPTRFVQENVSRSVQGVLRGMHYQIQQPQGKLVRVTLGTVFDVAVDMRRSSNNFGKAVGVTLSADNKHQLWIPPGFAHGFYVLSEAVEFSYKCTDYYAPQFERSLIWNDSDVAIKWPLVEGVELRLSEKDAVGLTLHQAETFP